MSTRHRTRSVAKTPNLHFTPPRDALTSKRKLRSRNRLQSNRDDMSQSLNADVDFVKNRSKRKVTPTTENGNAKLSGDWKEEPFERIEQANSDSAEQLASKKTDKKEQRKHESVLREQTEEPFEGKQLGNEKRNEAIPRESSKNDITEPPTDAKCWEKKSEKQLVNATTNNDTFEVFKHDEFKQVGNHKVPERRLTFELDNSINDIHVLKRDSELFSMLEKSGNSSRVTKGIRKKKMSNENRILRKKVGIVLENITPPNFSPFNKKHDSVIVISSGSSAESTPIRPAPKEKNKNKIDLLKHTLMRKYNAKIVEASNNSNSFKRKMPDFALLHKKEFDRMEDIASMKKRKEERAKVLLSGSKPLKTRNVASPVTKKSLFARPTPTLKSTPPKRVKFTPEAVEGGAARVALPKTPKPLLNSEKERRKTKEGFTRYGFKKRVAAEKENKMAEVLAVANKSKAAVGADSNKQKRRELLRGVRSNRRFELLMAMRKGRS